ncbi:MAG: tRNA lysidine(34) synthetase TilS [Acidobacteria bacterium]|nr:tRNA lysidine(34) synthetase TilS [Acidobacteriota bacterium]
MYYVAVHHLANKLAHSIRRQELLCPGDRVGVAVSGGRDSVALLRLLLELRQELGIVLVVVHVNHRLRGSESESDADFVSCLAREHKLELCATVADVAQHACDTGMSVEAAARDTRLRFFRALLGNGLRPEPTGTGTNASADDSYSRRAEGGVPVHKRELNKVVTAHTLDDQAETVLMRIIRGTGMRGLRSIQPRIEVQSERGTRAIVRPLLQLRRHALEQYLGDIGQSWREDATNCDPKFTRNRVRQLLVPVLEREFNPSFAERLAELAEIARAEQDFWDNKAAGWVTAAIHRLEPDASCHRRLQALPAWAQGGPQSTTSNREERSRWVDRRWLLSQSLAVERRVLKVVAEKAGFPLDFAKVEEILALARGEHGAGKRLALPNGWRVKCTQDALEFISPPATSLSPALRPYELRLTVPGEVEIPEIGSRLQAIRIEAGERSPHCDSDHLFDPALLAKDLTVRSWRPGDRFWPAHTRAAKKVKELLEKRRVHGFERSLWPVVLSGNEVIWVRGFRGRAHMRPMAGEAAVLIRELDGIKAV